jgi:hypothetical protein
VARERLVERTTNAFWTNDVTKGFLLDETTYKYVHLDRRNFRQEMEQGAL